MSPNGIFLSNPQDICNSFASHFQNIYTSDSSSTISSPVNIQNSEPPVFTNINITPDEVVSFINTIDINCGPGPDLIPPILLLNSDIQLAVPLTFLFNHSLQSGVFPELWKSSFLIPTYKKGVKTVIENYRGIAKLSTIPKLLEKIVVHKIGSSIDSLLNEQQHGFRPGRSTTTNLAVFTSSLLCSLEKGLSVDTVYTDFSKAFDTVSHKILVSKLRRFGFVGPLLSWFSSYLDNRTQVVKVQGLLSNIILVLSGVPQGSHLGPLLFNIFISDLSFVLKNIDHLFFADDLKIFHIIKDSSDVEFLQSKLLALETWCSANKLELNIDKCNIITFSRKQTINHFTYRINNKTLHRVDFIIDLGVCLDVNLNFAKHYDLIIAKSKRMLGFIKRRAQEFNNVWVTKTLYCSLVRPLLEYCSLIWDPLSNTLNSSIESIQRQFLLFALRNRYNPRDFDNLPSYKYRLSLLNMQSLANRRMFSTVSFTFDVITNKIVFVFILNLTAFHLY